MPAGPPSLLTPHPMPLMVADSASLWGTHDLPKKADWPRLGPSDTLRRGSVRIETDSRHLLVALLLKRPKKLGLRWPFSNYVHVKTERWCGGEGKRSRCKKWYKEIKQGKTKWDPGYWISGNQVKSLWGLLFSVFLGSTSCPGVLQWISFCAPANLNRFLFVLKPLDW